MIRLIQAALYGDSIVPGDVKVKVPHALASHIFLNDAFSGEDRTRTRDQMVLVVIEFSVGNRFSCCDLNLVEYQGHASRVFSLLYRLQR